MKILFFFLVFSSFLGWQSAFAQTEPGFTIKQEIRNLTRQNFMWASSTQASPGDRLELRTTITWGGGDTTNNVLVREMIDEKLDYEGNVKLDGTPIAGNVAVDNVNIRSINPNQQRIITFETTVRPPSSFPAMNMELVNTSTVFNTENAASAISRVQVTREGKPTDVSTGPLTLWMVGGFLAAAVAAVAGFVFFTRYYVKTRVLESTYETRTERKLDNMIKQIEKQEQKRA